MKHRLSNKTSILHPVDSSLEARFMSSMNRPFFFRLTNFAEGNDKERKNILRIGLYFMVLGILCSCLIPIYLSNPFENSGLDLAVPFFVILVCAPRLFYDKIWASLLLLTCAILTTLWLLYFTGAAVLQTIANLDVFDGFIISFLIIVTFIAMLSCYLCCRLYKLLFKTKETV